ncbi:hypothetical protein N1028_15420 [Herbiconiux sp. CPCC 203407]|uniref:Leucine rich repeat variant domain-containing protein n=1 Tax=Herbiconiux oxytropis TaxID=2970915 RepID=A0AA41XFJ2_9MICO|nr:hypothetical protein [Herbiconiux oxytropis]MCS5722319.1 hypothetical protein [Herbiconiux oxytropis]MCS5727284.1 hypothetical protein [Herbiconiux oxytropis]
MTDEFRDEDRVAANAPGVPPGVLADIAARRWDLHADIAANPRAYPELVQWMRTVNPADGLRRRPPAPARRSGAGWWLVGCGCLVFAIVVVVGIVGIAAALLPPASQGNSETAPLQTVPPSDTERGEAPTDPVVAEQIALFRADQPIINELAAQLEGNPVAPLVADLRTFRLDEKRADDPTVGIYEAKPMAERAAALRADLEQKVASARERSANASGSITEAIVDAAGSGFIDIRWDAASACSTAADPGRETIGCVLTADPLTVHLLPETEVGSVWMNQMLVTHELAHVYQRADDQGAADYSGAYRDLLAQGLFQSSDEAMADCFALTYFDQWSLTNGSESQGTGYVCNEPERQAIRDWAAGLNVPMD